jgi:signal transduction histidine kinase
MRERPRDFVAAIGLALVALGVRALLRTAIGGLQPFAPGFVAIAAAVLYFGWRPAVLTAITSYVGGALLFLHQRDDLFSAQPRDFAALVTYGISAGLMIAMGHRVRRAERQLAEANQRLVEADHRKDEFLATVSHELRNPVGVIASAVVLLDAHIKDGPARAAVSVLARQSAHIQRLVSDLLDVGRITRGRMTLQTERVDLRATVEHAIESCRHTVAYKQQRVLVQESDAPIAVEADHARMVQVISNLVDNASKYSPDGSEIRVILRAEAGDAVIEVADAGPGIDPAVRPHVFDLFDQSGASSSGGLGLGLGLCKRIVDLHGGTIDAGENPDGVGARFTIRLPKRSVVAQDDTATPGGPANSL